MNARPNCPQGLNKENMQAISAPYNFVPLPEAIVTPEWGKQVSHDHPFQDGYSGEIHYTLTAQTPLLVGGKQEKNTANDRPNTEVHPFQLPDGRYAIPGSSLKGMLRSVVEVAGFGRMRMVDEQRPGLRDISGGYVSASYKEKVNSIETGFLRMTEDGGQEIIPCQMKRLHHRDIEEATGTPPPVFKQGMTVREKYRKWARLCQKMNWDEHAVPLSIDEHLAKPGEGSNQGFAVFTGQISDSRQDTGKKKDFIFYDEAPENAIRVDTRYWRDFLFIHEDEEPNSDRPWNGYWKSIYQNGGKVPVFYKEDNGILRIGLAYMPRLAGDFTTLDCIRHISTKHLDAPGKDSGYDFADLLFGAVNGEEQDDALRARVSVDMAIAEDKADSETQPDTILNGPKPSYFPNYITQKIDRNRRSGQLTGNQYATYMSTPSMPIPSLRGYKRYPVRPLDQTGVQALHADQRENKKVQVKLETLRQGARFRGRLVFHNLKREELGLLVWALSWGGDETLRHSLGMGKSFGFGQIRVELDYDRSVLIPNDPNHEPADSLRLLLQDASRDFEKYMERRLKPKGGWRASPQIITLKAMVDPECAIHLPTGMTLRHMCLNPKEKKNEFVWAKQKKLALLDYELAAQYARILKEREEKLAQRRKAEEEALRKQQREGEKARKQAELNALPDHERAMLELEEFVSGLPDTLIKERYTELVTMINDYIQRADPWPCKYRIILAEKIEQTYDRYGWGRPGLRSYQKKKQKAKKIKELDRLRNCDS